MIDWLKSLTKRSRESVFAVMREIGWEAQHDFTRANRLIKAGDMSGVEFRLKSFAAETILQSLREGSIPEQATLIAYHETAAPVRSSTSSIGRAR